MLLREIDERWKIWRASNVKVVSASYNPRYRYPWRLGKVKKCWDALTNSCFEFYLDSGYKNADIENKDVLDEAAKYSPTVVFPKDYPGYADETIKSLKRFEEMENNRADVDVSTIVPILQPPYVDHLKEHEEYYERFGHFAVGGLQAYDPVEQVAILRQVRDEIGRHKTLHAFGVGTSLPMIRAMREYDNFIDSFDTSTAEYAIKNESIPDASFKQNEFKRPYGPDSTTVRANFSIAILTMINYMLSDLVDEEHLDRIYHEESNLADLRAAVDNINVRSRHDVQFGISEADMPDNQATTLGSFN